ncbi:MAG TPA: FAD-dependent oxidoreductase [Candidatus Limnocylindria bacterium]|nr:FAD-dependent oxidoreductase [Candidatus Limnocylindria bacterium]
MFNANSDEVLVVGGGIGGLATALSLVRRGHQVRVLERAKEFTEVGAGIQLAPNATRILIGLGLLDDILEVGVLPRRLVLADAIDGRELTSLSLGDFPERYGGPYVVMHRSDLLRILLENCAAAGVALDTEAHVTDVEQNPAGVRARCQDGRRFEGRLLLGADGLHSHMRSLFAADEPICSGYVAYRGAVPMSQVEQHADLRDVVAWIGPGMHLVQYPLRSGSMYNQVAVFRSPAFARGESDWGTPTELDSVFAVCCEHVRASVPLLGRDNRWPMYDRLPIQRWTTGRIALLGDAAHPMLQYLAQGACQAIQDAGTLAGALPTDLTDSTMVEAALRSYETVRAPHTAQVQANARVWGEIWHCDGVAKLLRDEVLLERRPDDLRHVEWLYGDRAGSPQLPDVPARPPRPSMVAR